MSVPGARPGLASVTVLAAIAGVLFFALPVVALVANALLGPSFGATVQRPSVIHALALSLGTTAVSLALTVLFGTPLAYVLARRRVPGRRLLETVVDLPIVLPPAVAGLALLLLFGRNGPVGAALVTLGVDLAFTTAAVVIAQLFVSAPFYVRAARVGFAGVDHDVEDAARVDGAGEWAVFRHVTVPLASSALSSGVVMAWVRALGEFGATIMFAGNIEGRTQTLPLEIYAAFQVDLGASIAAGALLVLAALTVLLVVRAVRRAPAEELELI